MKILVPLVGVFILSLSMAVHGDTLIASKLENFPKRYNSHKPKGASRCTGQVDKAKTAKYPWIQERIATGIDCLAADFDGNGTVDFALLKDGWSSDTRAVGTTEIVALMYDSKGLSNVLLVTSNHPIFTLEIYPPTNKKGQFGEPTTKNPGLVTWGEGDATTIWLFKSGKFEPANFPSENL